MPATFDAPIAFLKAHNLEFHRQPESGCFTTLKIGGRVGLAVIVPDRSALAGLLHFLHENRFPYIILGSGSNVVFTGDSPDLIVLCNRAACPPILKEGLIQVDSGLPIKNLLAFAVENEIGGLEFLAGIPGTIGGAAAVNAGAFGQSLADILQKADIFTAQGKVKTVGADYFQYTYRDSVFKYSPEVILTVYLAFRPTPGKDIREKITAHIKYRQERHPPAQSATAGCFFKNPIIDDRKVSAGKLIAEAGLKGLTGDGLEVSTDHANFLINRGGAGFTGLDRFVRQIQETVSQESGIHLEREVIYISPSGQKY